MSRSLTFEYCVLTCAVWLTLFMNSAMPNRPSASATSSMPSSSSGKPKVSRSAPVSRSEPTRPKIKPSTVMATPLIGEPRAKRRAGQQAEQHQRADLGRAEFQRDRDQQRRQEHHLGDAPRRADERPDHGDGKGNAALALLGHREAVETRDRVRWMTRQVEQDRADRAAVLRAVEDARQHQDGADRLDAEGQRQQDRDGRERPHAGQHADHVADQHAEEAVHQVVRLERDAEAVPKVLEGRFHRNYSLHSRTGIGICSR